MIVSKPDWQTLNAYVDGELDGEVAASVVEAAARDAALANRLAALYRLKAAMPGAFAHSTIARDEATPKPISRWPRRLLPLAMAATIILAVGIGLWFSQAFVGGKPLDPGTLDQARMLHETWLGGTSASETASPGKVLAALHGFGRLPVIPDLQSTGLTIGLVKTTRLNGEPLLQVGYRGHNGCHLSLFVFGGEPLPRQVKTTKRGTELASAWRAGELGYLLFAEGMDESRFTLISQVVEHASRMGAPLDRSEQQLLVLNKQNSASCAA